MPETVLPKTVIQRSRDRARQRLGWIDTAQSFPFAGNFDLTEHAHGVLMVNNEDIVDAGHGFDTHQHQDVEIVTWVVSGSLVHQDSRGNSGIVHPGLAQRMSAGRGILHSERNDHRRADGSPVADPVHGWCGTWQSHVVEIAYEGSRYFAALGEGNCGGSFGQAGPGETLEDFVSTFAGARP